MESENETIAGNRAAQTDEMEVLKSIYGEDYISHDDFSCEVLVRPLEGDERLPPLKLCAYFPDSYPSGSEPIFEMEAPWLQQELTEKISVELRRLYEENAGNVIIFTWIEWLKEQPWVWEDARNKSILTSASVQPGDESACKPFDEDETEEINNCGVTISHELDLKNAKGKQLPNRRGEDKSVDDLDSNNTDELDTVLGIIHGAPFMEKKSTFQAHLANVNSVDQVETIMEALLQNRKIAGATHNIMAYRISIPEKGTVLQDYDDDGETAAGGRLLHLLQIVDAINVVVVVSRWFGGVLLGPDRFKHINNAARTLLNACGYIKGSGQPVSQAAAKQKSQSKGITTHKGRRH